MTQLIRRQTNMLFYSNCARQADPSSLSPASPSRSDIGGAAPVDKWAPGETAGAGILVADTCDVSVLRRGESDSEKTHKRRCCQIMQSPRGATHPGGWGWEGRDCTCSTVMGVERLPFAPGFSFSVGDVRHHVAYRRASWQHIYETNSIWGLQKVLLCQSLFFWT